MRKLGTRTQAWKSFWSINLGVAVKMSPINRTCSVTGSSQEACRRAAGILFVDSSVDGGVRPCRVRRELQGFCSHDNNSQMILIVTRNASITAIQCNSVNNSEVLHETGSVCVCVCVCVCVFGGKSCWYKVRHFVLEQNFKSLTVLLKKIDLWIWYVLTNITIVKILKKFPAIF